MAFDSYYAGLRGYFAANLSLAGQLPLDPKTTTCTISRDITQASTLTIAIEDPDRAVLNSPLANQTSLITIGGISFNLVKVGKQGHTTTLTAEDSVIARLRTIKGPLAAAGIVPRVHFAAELCRQAGVPFIGAPGTPSALEPLSRGTSENPQEDTWSCLVRLAQDVAYRCFSDGTSVLFGPDSWLFASPPVMTIREFEGGVDFIDVQDWDIGKPLAEASVSTYCTTWHGDVGAIIAVQGLGPASTTWLVAGIQRDLFHTPITVRMVRPQPTLPEPAPTG